MIGELPQSKPDGFASSLWEGASGETGSFAVEPETLPLCQRPHLRGGCRRRRLGEFAPRNTPLPSAPAGRSHLPQGDGFWQCRKVYRRHERLPPWGSWRVAPEGVTTAAPPLPQEAGAANAACRHDPACEKGVLKSPQAFQNPKIINNSSAATTTTAASGGNREELLGQRPARRECRPRHEADAGCRNPEASGGHFQSSCPPGHPAARHAAHSTSFSALESFFRAASRRKAARLSAQRSI